MISLRSHERADIPLRIKWLNNKQANTYLVDNPDHITDTEEQNEWFDNYEASEKKKFFTIMSNEEPIGFTGLSNIDMEAKSASVFIVIGEDDFRGKGKGKMVLDLLLKEGIKLGVKTFNLDVFKENVPAVKLYKKAGFIEVGEIENSTVLMSLSV